MSENKEMSNTLFYSFYCFVKNFVKNVIFTIYILDRLINDFRSTYFVPQSWSLALKNGFEIFLAKNSYLITRSYISKDINCC